MSLESCEPTWGTWLAQPLLALGARSSLWHAAGGRKPVYVLYRIDTLLTVTRETLEPRRCCRVTYVSVQCCV